MAAVQERKPLLEEGDAPATSRDAPAVGRAYDDPESDGEGDGPSGFSALLARFNVPGFRQKPRWNAMEGGVGSRDAAAGISSMDTPLPERYRKYHAPRKNEEHGFSNFVAICFTINFIVGAGFLGMPKAFVEAGLGLGMILLVLFTGFCNITKDYLLEAMSRAEAITEARLRTNTTGTDLTDGKTTERLKRSLQGRGRSFSADGEDPNDAVETIPSERSYGTRSRTQSQKKRNEAYVITRRKFELTEVVELFLGHRMKLFFTTVVCLYMYGVLWAFSSVFAASAAANIPVFFLRDGQTCDVYVDFHSCSWNYHVFLLVFAAVVVPLSCLELKEQVTVQVTMSMARFLVMGLLVATVLFAAECPNTTFVGTQSHASETEWFKLSGIATMVPVAVYAQMFHLSIPVLSQPVTKKRELPQVFAWSFFLTTVCYTGIGIVLAIYFGPQMLGQCNLMWDKYVGCGLALDTRPWWAAVVAFFLLIFPALDVMSAFPLNAITLGNNMLSAFAADQAPKMEMQSRRLVTFFRLLAAIPPIVGAAFVTNLDTILDYTGLIGFIVTFFVPCIVVLKSRAKCAEIFPSDVKLRNPYTGAYDFGGLPHLILIVSGATALYIAVNLVAGDLGDAL